METKNSIAVVSLKLKNGDDVMGVYVGEMKMSFGEEPAIVLLRPIKIHFMNNVTDRGISTIYAPTLYFPYGDPQIPFPMSMIDQQTVANPFFRRFYFMVAPELIDNEQTRHEAIEKAFDDIETENILKNTSSSFIVPETNQLQ